MLQRGTPKLGKDGKPMKDKRGKVIYEPYRIKVLNTINFKKSMHYNPFSYIHSEKDILKLVTTLIANTKGEGKAGDDFWVKAETLLYCALIGYIHYEAPVEEQNFSTLIEFINAMEVREDDEEFKNPVDLMFDALEAEKPNHFAVRQYKKYKLAAGVVCSKRLLNQAVGKSLRTHNLKPKKGAQVMRKNEKITALYERLSRDDFGKDDDQQRESNSISNQKAMLEEFAARQGFTNIVHFTDDGISGTCFDRPGFLAMMKEVEAGNVEYLCIKDMSRMGRDYLKVGQIMEILRQRGVRLIAINDGVDSARGDDDFTPLAYVPVPKDLTKVKTKVAFNLTKRQLICFGSGALIGVPLFFLLRGPVGNSVAAMCMMLVMLPFFLMAMYEKHGQPLEKIVGNIIKVAVIRPKQRPYKTNNFYAVLERQEKLDKEVYDIVHRNEKPAGR